jgi:hypothetical protein
MNTLTKNEMNLMLSKYLLSVLIEHMKYDFRAELFKSMIPSEPEGSIIQEIMDKTLCHVLPNQKEYPYSVCLKELKRFNKLRNKLFGSIENLFDFNDNYDLTKQKYPFSKKMFIGTSITDKERGAKFRENFLSSISQMEYFASKKFLSEHSGPKGEPKPSDIVLNFLNEAREMNPSIFEYLKLTTEDMDLKCIQSLIGRESNKHPHMTFGPKIKSLK